FHAASLNAENSMHCGAMDHAISYLTDLERLQWIPCSVVQWILIERSGFHASWCNGSQLNAVDSMQCGGVDSD
ncbi:hypothetical protein PSZ46_23375, partial [Shigella flexneri]|nr:hypothetical protein [Shigella flexneri]